jgi:SAM-dependent methyltransferase
MKSKLDRFGKWMYEFDLGDGVKTPLYLESLRKVHQARHEMIFDFLDGLHFDYRSADVLDIGCNEGYFLFEMLKCGARSGLGLEGRAENISKARFIEETLGIKHCEFREADVLDVDLGSEHYDIVLLLGLIYHVEDPIGLLRRAAKATKRFLFLETQLCKSEQPIKFGWGVPDVYHDADAYLVLHEERDDNPLASMGGLSMIPNLNAVTTMLRQCGFRNIVQLHADKVRETQYDRGDRAMFVGIK